MSTKDNSPHESDHATLMLNPVSSCLSPYVHTLVTSHTQTKHMDDQVLDLECCLDFSYICSKMPAPVGNDSCYEDMSTYFCGCVLALAPMLHIIDNRLAQIQGNRQALSKTYNDMVQWTGQHKLLCETWESMSTSDPIDNILVLLVTTTVLERSLGDLYLTVGPAPCPSMLKDLLVTSELHELLGRHVIQVLRIIIGPPTSLNLRNIVWHGFPFPGEIPRSCIWFLILLVPSIGSIINKLKSHQQIKHREPITLPEIITISETNLLTTDLDGWMELLSQSQLVSWPTHTFWSKLQLLYSQQRYGECAGLLLYYLEHGLRHVFASVNGCEDRVLTAEATSLFTTFDEMLQPYLPDGTENQLRYVIGDHVTEILLDVLLYQDGPRIRDRLSHGEVSWDMFPRQLTDNLVVIAIVLSDKFIPAQNYSKNGDIDKIKQDVLLYQVQFHRISIIKNKVQSCCTSISMVDNLVTVMPDLSQRLATDIFPLSAQHKTLEDNIGTISDVIVQRWISTPLSHSVTKCIMYRGCIKDHCKNMEEILSHKINTLYRHSKLKSTSTSECDRESEILSHLHHVSVECFAIIDQLQHFIILRQQQLTDKQLRSRQRDNFKKFLENMPSFVVMVNISGFLVAWQLYHLQSTWQQPDGNITSIIRFWKTHLQFCENMRTFSNSEKNKWKEGFDLIQQYTKTLGSSIQKCFSMLCP